MRNGHHHQFVPTIVGNAYQGPVKATCNRCGLRVRNVPVTAITHIPELPQVPGKKSTHYLWQWQRAGSDEGGDWDIGWSYPACQPQDKMYPLDRLPKSV